jgi:hypothetical protein
MARETLYKLWSFPTAWRISLTFWEDGAADYSTVLYALYLPVYLFIGLFLFCSLHDKIIKTGDFSKLCESFW